MTYTHRPIFFSVAILVLAAGARAQVPADDPFGGLRVIAPSDEIVVFTAAENGTVERALYDSNGAVETGGLLQSSIQSESGADGHAGDFPRGDIDTVMGDLTGDGLADIAAVWEGTGRTIRMVLPEISRGDGPGASDWNGSQAVRFDVQDDGYPLLIDRDDFNNRRMIRLVTGNFDKDENRATGVEEQDEIVLAYLGDAGSSDDGPIQIIIYDTAGSLAPVAVGSIADEMLFPSFSGIGAGLARSARFDIATGDFDYDGTDEIALAAVQPCPDPCGWELTVKIYDVGEDYSLTSRGRSPAIQAQRFDKAWGIGRMGIAAGNLAGDLFDDIAITYQSWLVDQQDWEAHLDVVEVEDLDTLTIGATSGIFQNGSSNPLGGSSITAGDVDLDGRDEIVEVRRGVLRVWRYDAESDRVSNVASAFSLENQEEYVRHRIVAVTDLDVVDGGEVEPEIVVADWIDDDDDTLLVRVWQNQATGGGVTLNSTPDAEFSRNLGFNQDFRVALAVGDLDGDSVQLGAPTRQRRTDMVQPLVILNAPPTHFDAFDWDFTVADPGDPTSAKQCYLGANQIDPSCFDVNKCFNPAANVNCEHKAIYETASSVELEVSSEVSADWAVSESLEGEAGVELPFFSASVKAKLDSTYGGGFSNVAGSSETIIVRRTIEAIEDDRIYATISNYDIFEYPVFADGDPIGSVVSVVPITVGLGALDHNWFASKGATGRSWLNGHEVGHALSYSPTANLPPGAMIFGQGTCTQAGCSGAGAGDTWEMDEAATNVWQIEFNESNVQQASQSQFMQVGRSVSAKASGGFGPFSASLEGTVSETYGETSISTHRTTVGETTKLTVGLHQVDGSILGDDTYNVTPFVYWAENGALVLDYAVDPALPLGSTSWWEQRYNAPDLTFVLPKRNNGPKGIGVRQGVEAILEDRQETRDILFDPANPIAGELVTISARVQNFGLVDAAPTTLRFYLGDPEQGGQLIVNEGAVSNVNVPRVNARESVVVELPDWRVPSGVALETKVYAWVDPANMLAGEVHENNNIGWNLLAPNEVEFIPEPGAGACGLAALLTLGGLAARPRRRSRTGRDDDEVSELSRLAAEARRARRAREGDS